MKPTNIIVDINTKQLQISWDTGHISVYDFLYLRRACPCAECQPWKEGGGEVGKRPPSVFNDPAELKSVSDVVQMGSYAIQFNWASGHIYGIYTWEYLLQLCPCDEHNGKNYPDLPD
jgi:DUF971 family protein